MSTGIAEKPNRQEMAVKASVVLQRLHAIIVSGPRKDKRGARVDELIEQAATSEWGEKWYERYWESNSAGHTLAGLVAERLVDDGYGPDITPPPPANVRE
jgi:hypothetical protein